MWKKPGAHIFFAGGATLFPYETSKQHLIPPIFLDIVYWARVHAGAGRAAGRNSEAYILSSPKRLEDRSFFSPLADRQPMHLSQRRSLVGRCGCVGVIKAKVFGAKCPAGSVSLPPPHLLKGQRGVRGFEGGRGEK